MVSTHSKHEALSSNPSIKKKGRKEGGREGGRKERKKGRKKTSEQQHLAKNSIRKLQKVKRCDECKI
jgi:hypothetical protein